jgi:hypothetical protein
MRSKTPALAVLSALISLPLLVADAHAQAERSRAPVINLSVPLGNSVASNYIEPMIRLSEDAYVFAISVDVDSKIQVLHPDFPGLSVKMTSRRQLHLPSFFAGYGQNSRSMGSGYSGYASSYYDGYDPGFSDARGTVIALASHKPFNLDAVTSGGEWDFAAIRRLVNGRDPQSVASALARYIGAKGEPIGRDIYRFAGAQHNYYSSAYYECSTYGRSGYAHPFAQWRVDSFRAAQLRAAGFAVRFLGTDACGEPRYAVYSQQGTPTPIGRPPATGAFPRSRVPTVRPRNPARDEIIAGRMSEKTALRGRNRNQDVYTNPPPGRTRDPQSGVDRGNPRAATGAFPERRRPERPAPSTRVDNPERRAAPAPAPTRAPIERGRPERPTQSQQ